MSHSFYVGGISSLAYEDVLSALDPDRDELRCEENDLAELRGPWPESGYHHFYRWGTSTRTVEISRDAGVFNARILVGSCPADYRLALDLVTAAARAVGGMISGEDGPEGILPDAVVAHWGDRWIEDHSWAMARTVLGIAERDGGGEVLTLSGPLRAFSLGPRVVAALRAGPDEGIEQRLFAMMRRLQYVAGSGDDDGVFCASAMAMSRRDDGAEQIRFAVWAAGVSYLMPSVDYLALVAPSQIFVPIGAAEMLAPGRVTYLDDKHLLIDAVPEDEWERLVVAAEALAVDPLGNDGAQ